MHALFRVAFTLLGIHFLFRGLIYVISAILFFDGGWDRPTFLPFLHAALAFSFAFILIIQPAWLSRRARTSADESTFVDGFDARALLRVGIVLIGLFVVATQLESVLHLLSMHLDGTRFGGLSAPVRILIASLPLVLAALFVARPDRVVDVIARENVSTPSGPASRP